jgi:hypothetical protein
MWRALFAIPTFVTTAGVRVVAPTDVALVVGDVGQHRFVVGSSAVIPAIRRLAIARPATARLLHGSSLRADESVLGWDQPGCR